MQNVVKINGKEYHMRVELFQNTDSIFRVVSGVVTATGAYSIKRETVDETVGKTFDRLIDITKNDEHLDDDIKEVFEIWLVINSLIIEALV